MRRRFLEVVRTSIGIWEFTFALLRTRKNDFSRDENEEHKFGLDHPVDQTWEEFWLEGGKLSVVENELLETDREFDVYRANHVLDLEVFEFRWKTEFLNHARVFSRCEARFFFWFCS